MEDEIKTAVQPEATAEVVDIQFRPGQKVYFFDPNGLQLSAGDHVIIDTARGPEYGTVAAGNHTIRSADVVTPLRSVIRVANAQDEKIAAENKAKEKRAYEVCLQKIGEQGLDMQLVSAEYAFDGSKILFFFTADERVDFRELVKNLASVFHTRIELRQIGVRDKAKMVGGLGICGRPFCCASFLDDFQPVSIKMAKTQNLSLKYEQEAYEDLIRNSPKAESFVDTPEGRGTVVEIDLLRQRVKVRMEDAPETVSTFSNSDIAVLRNGKAKKNDPPIPADLAPISGSGKRVRKQEEDTPVFLDPIRFRYSTEKIVEEPEVEEPEQPITEEAAPAEPKRSRRRRKPRAQTDAAKEETAPETKPEPKKDAPKADKKPKHEKKDTAESKEEAAPSEGEAPANKRRRRPNFRRRKPKNTDSGNNS